jgi:hypothetical protein
MNKKDYEKLASVFRDTRPAKDEEMTLWSVLVDRMGQTLWYDNPMFNFSRWRKACGKEEA